MSLLSRSDGGHRRRAFGWLAAAALVTGSGVWSTHFVGMLAFQPALPTGFDFGLTALSILVAVILSGFGYVIAFPLGRPALGGAVLGSAIAAMHYVGMAGYVVPAVMHWDMAYVAASLLLGTGLGAAAIAAMRRREGFAGRVAGAAVFALAICAMHFTGMAAVTLTPDPTLLVPDSIIPPQVLVIFVAVVTLAIMAFGLAGSAIDQRFAQRSALEAARLRDHVEELERTRVELEGATLQLKAALGAAEEANRAKSEFLATISHEVRTPLNGILGMAAALLRSDLEPRVREGLTVIRQSGDALLHILNDILDLSKIEAGRITIEESDFSLRGLVEAAETLWAPHARSRRLAFASHCGDGPALLRGDVSRIRQVLHNLISNAIKFTHRGGVTVQASVEPLENTGRFRLRLSVADTGIGLDSEQIGRIFQPFVQGDGSTTRRYGGTGLGLSISKKLVTLLGGEIGVESRPGEGSRFWFTVPVGPGEARQQPETAPPPAPVPAPATRPEQRLLVAEDNPVNQKLVGLLLAPLGCAIDYVANGREAVAAVRAARYDAVLMDVQMPEMDGIGATRAIRALADPERAATPIIALTANAMQGDREAYLRQGVDDYLSKPVDPEALLAVVGRWLTGDVVGKAARAA